MGFDNYLGGESWGFWIHTAGGDRQQASWCLAGLLLPGLACAMTFVVVV